MAELVEGDHRRLVEGAHRRPRRRRRLLVLGLVGTVLLAVAATAAVMYWPRGEGRSLAGDECSPVLRVTERERWGVRRHVGAVWERDPGVVTRCQVDLSDPVGSVRVEAVFYPGPKGPAEARDWQRNFAEAAGNASEAKEGRRVTSVPGVGELASATVVTAGGGTVVDLFAVDGELAVWVTIAAIVQDDQDLEMAADLARGYLDKIEHS